MNVKIFILIVAIISFVLTYLVYKADKKSSINRSFAVFTFSVGLWALAFFCYEFSIFFSSLIWIKIIYSIVFVLIYSVFRFLYIFPEEKKSPSIIPLIYTFLSIPLFFILWFTDWWVQRVVMHSWGPETVLSPKLTYLLVSLLWCSLIIWMIIIIIRNLLSLKGVQKIQYYYISFSLLITVFLVIVADVIIPLVTGYTRYFWTSPISFLIFIAFTTFAIIRYRLFRIKVILTELLVGVMGIILATLPFLMETLQLKILTAGIFLVFCYIGHLLIKSTYREIGAKEILERKVAAQTIEIRRAYEVEKKARVELEELGKAKDQFILTTQHHLRTPLTIVKGYLQFLLGSPPQAFIPQTKSYLEKASSVTDKMADLVNEFLDISQIQVGKSILNKEPTNLKTIIENILDELSPDLTKKHLQISFIFPPKKEDNILNVDKKKLKEALTNLIDNSIKYNQEGGSITIEGEKTYHPIERDKEIYRLTIEDTGIGLAEEELSKLFIQYFQRGKEAEKLYTTGRGIGLVLTKNIINAHEGKVWAESGGRGKGARFTIELPI